MQRKVFDEVEAQLDIESDTDINNAKPPKSRMSLQHTVSKFMTTWNGPMVEFYSAQQKALGHVVEGMRLCFQLRGQIRCLVNMFEPWGREAMVLPPSSTLTLTLTLTPAEIGTPFSSPVSLSGRVPL